MNSLYMQHNRVGKMEYLQSLFPLTTWVAAELRSPKRNLQYKQKVRQELPQKCTMISARENSRSLAELEE